MDEDVLKRYQEVISLLQFRNPGYIFHGEFKYDEKNNVAFKLTCINSLNIDTNKKDIIFKYMDSPLMALKYFIHAAQNRTVI